MVCDVVVNKVGDPPVTLFATDPHPAVFVVRPEGRLDLLTAPRLRSLVTDAVHSGHNRIIVDLGNTQVLDSSGLGALVDGLMTAREAGGDLRVARPSEQARMVLELATLERVLRTHESVESAIDAGWAHRDAPSHHPNAQPKSS